MKLLAQWKSFMLDTGSTGQVPQRRKYPLPVRVEVRELVSSSGWCRFPEIKWVTLTGFLIQLTCKCETSVTSTLSLDASAFCQNSNNPHHPKRRVLECESIPFLPQFLFLFYFITQLNWWIRALRSISWNMMLICTIQIDFNNKKIFKTSSHIRSPSYYGQIKCKNKQKIIMLYLRIIICGLKLKR